MTTENRRLADWEILQGRNSKRGRRILFATLRNVEKAKHGDKKARGKVVGSIHRAYLSLEKVRNKRREAKAEKQDGISYEGTVLPITITELSVLMDMKYAKGDMNRLGTVKRDVLQKLINDGKQWIIDKFLGR